MVLGEVGVDGCEGRQQEGTGLCHKTKFLHGKHMRRIEPNHFSKVIRKESMKSEEADVKSRSNSHIVR